jgi:hypothetical protein
MTAKMRRLRIRSFVSTRSLERQRISSQFGSKEFSMRKGLLLRRTARVQK